MPKFTRRNFIECSLLMGVAQSPLISAAAESKSTYRLGFSHSFPVAGVTYDRVASFEIDFSDLQSHGVGLVSLRPRTTEEARLHLNICRKYKMAIEIGIADITEEAHLVKLAGLLPVDALMIGGAYQGKAVDRHLFKFSAGPHTITIEPPVYSSGFPYIKPQAENSGKSSELEAAGHYFPRMPAPRKAEIVVPHRHFDGTQHLTILTATIVPAPSLKVVEGDTVPATMAFQAEVSQRILYQVSFDLTGLDNALLDQVGVAVYWPYNGAKSTYYNFGGGNVSAAAPTTKEALRVSVRTQLQRWTDANNGIFPSDVVRIARFGDESFYVTSHLTYDSPPSINYPLWDYSEPAIQAYRKLAGEPEYPRTWGFPEIYGTAPYGWWLYSLHQQAAS